MQLSQRTAIDASSPREQQLFGDNCWKFSFEHFLEHHQFLVVILTRTAFRFSNSLPKKTVVLPKNLFYGTQLWRSDVKYYTSKFHAQTYRERFPAPSARDERESLSLNRHTGTLNMLLDVPIDVNTYEYG